MNPIWTVASGSFFLLNVSPEDFFGAQSLSFFVADDSISSNESLGKAFVTQEDLLKGDGARIEYDLETPVGHRQILPVKHGLNHLYKYGAGLVSEAETQAEEQMIGVGNDRLHPVNDLKKMVRRDSDDDDDEEGGLDKFLLRPANDVQKLVRGDSEEDDGGGVGPVSGAFSWIRNRAQSDTTTRAAKLVLRFRKPSDEDLAFMDRLATAQKEGATGLYADESFVSIPRVQIASRLFARTELTQFR